MHMAQWSPKSMLRWKTIPVNETEYKFNNNMDHFQVAQQTNENDFETV